MKGRILKANKAVSPVVSTVLIVSIVVSSIAIILGWGLPYIEEQNIKSQKQTAENGLVSLSDSINDLILQGIQTSGVSEISNENGMGSITLNPKSDKFVIWYSFNSSYDFNVSGLDDEDETFRINETSKPSVEGELDQVDIYKINAGSAADRFNIDSGDDIWYKKIYRNDTDGESVCSQRFKAPANWNIDGVRFYIAKYGTINTNLNVTIYVEDNDGDLNPLGCSKVVDSIDVSSSFKWVSCDLPNTLLSKNKFYHILINTSGGNKSNFYYWYLRENIYGDSSGSNGNSTDEYALNGSSAFDFDPLIDSLDDMKGRDYLRRILYYDNSPPTTPEIKIEGKSALNHDFFSGITYNFTINSTDSERDDISYSIIWGDGNKTGWLPFCPSSNYYIDKAHAWPEAGTYQMYVQAKDEHENIGISSATLLINVEPFETIPSDVYSKFLNSTESNGFSRNGDKVDVDISSRYPNKILDGDLFINLIDWNNIIYPDKNDPVNETHNGTDGKVPFGRVWVFDVGSLKITAPYQSESIETIYQNGAIISKTSTGNEVIKDPTIFEKTNANQTETNETNALSIRITQINGSISVGGSSLTSTLEYVITDSLSREPYVVDNFYNLKMQIFGENQDFWYDYLSQNYGFTLSSYMGNKLLIYNQEVDSFHPGNEDFSLIFDNSFIDFRLVRVR